LACAELSVESRSAGQLAHSVPVENLYEVIPKLAFDRAVHFTQGSFEDDLIDAAHHLPWTYLTQVAAFLAGRADGAFACQHIESFAIGDTFLQLSGFRLRFDQNVAGHGFGHCVISKRSGAQLYRQSGRGFSSKEIVHRHPTNGSLFHAW